MKETPVPGASARGGPRRGPRAAARRERPRPDHRRRKKACTKAVLKRRIRALLAAALAEIETAGRIDMLAAKKAHFEKAVVCLEALLGERPGACLLRRQHALCIEALREIDRGSPAARTLVVDTGCLEGFRI